MKELLVRFMGDTEANKRFTLTADNVSCDEAGLRRLIVSRYLIGTQRKILQCKNALHP